MLSLLFITSLIGFFIALYFYMTEQRLKRNKGFRPACDITQRVSCTKVIKSRYGHMYSVSNAAIGLVFYTIVCLCAYFEWLRAALVITAIGCVVSLVLAYLIYVRERLYCLLCTALYLINIFLLVVCIYYFR